VGLFQLFIILILNLNIVVQSVTTFELQVSTRLADTPTVVVTSKTGWSSNMERIMLAQTLVDQSKVAYMKSKRTLEINARHPVIQELRQRVAEDPKVHSVQLLYAL